jgi:CHAT domain-containing protein
LKSPKGFIADDHRIQYAPSVSIFVRNKNKSVQQNGVMLVLGYADQMAPLIEEESRAIQEIDPSATVFTGISASSEQIRRLGPDARILHLAGHGRFLPDQPIFSGILLADGWMTLPQIYGMKLNCSLATLSGCETGGNAILAGDELLGLVRAFLFAGTQSLLVSLWRVFDHSTAYFMKKFYAALVHGHSKTEAWSQAVLHTKAEWEHPYYWAPFQLIC